MFIHFHSNGVRFWSSAMASPFVTTTCRFWSGAMSSRNMSSSDSRSNNSSSSSKSWRDVDLDGSVEIQPLWFPPKKHVGEEKLSEANKLRWFCSWTRCGRTNRLANDRLLSWLVAASCGSQKWRTSFLLAEDKASHMHKYKKSRKLMKCEVQVPQALATPWIRLNKQPSLST